MSNHTRGPWMPSDINDGVLPRNEADVILMAAAPDLLNALGEMLDHFEDNEQYSEDDAAVIEFARRIYNQASGGE